MLILNEADVRRLASMEEAIDAVAAALREYSRGRTVTPVRAHVQVEKAGGTSLFMPSYVEARDSLGIKVVSVFPGNQAVGRRTINGVMLLADVHSGEPLALMEASYLTVLRTGAAAGLATRCLARAAAEILAVIGTGAQAEGAVAAIRAVRPIRQMRLYNRSRGKAEAFAARIAGQPGGSLAVKVCDDPDEAVAGADIVVTATTSPTPVFAADAVAPGTHVNAIGSYRPTMQELPSALLSRAQKVVVESREGALAETGDLLIPIGQGLFSADRIHGELGEIVDGRLPGRERQDEITVFKSVGLAAMDVVAAKLLYDRAVSLGVGSRISL
ncbi:ornithine cyclodeaminase family protein [Brevibacillus sp. SYP-B805]|uniref:ornithine cyclodeaminase family protein n=1 Tax=Brevibacillus sp. SYP-B805 TaxID=1578199 RepID=UPI0013E9BC83|nr:ornithine cyclodeaminase family protein [Brevibacillus sp. SYP-B805]NGQ97436.1 ornithine cyclodeaminase family protein [Brevibacillus sp. SYP-B805]